MSEKSDGGPAFPMFVPAYNGPTSGHSEHWADGMSMRDYFAAAALQGALAGIYARLDDAKELVDNANAAGRTLTECLAKGAYGYADAMLAESAK